MKPHRASLHYVERTIIGLDTPIAKGTYSEPQREGGQCPVRYHGPRASQRPSPPVPSVSFSSGGRGSVVLLAFLHVVALAYRRVLQYIQYSIFFDSCLGEERSLFEFEVVTLREPPGRDPSLLFYFHPYMVC